jgi:hypothetical protein
VQAFHKLGDHFIEGAACTEAGDQAFRIHLQCMFLMMVSLAPNNEDILKEWLLEELKLDEERSFRVYVRIHSENGNTVTREGQIGYVAKDWKKRHVQICYLRNITEQELADRGTHYLSTASRTQHPREEDRTGTLHVRQAVVDMGASASIPDQHDNRIGASRTFYVTVGQVH